MPRIWIDTSAGLEIKHRTSGASSRAIAAKPVTTYPHLVQSGYWWHLTVAFGLGFIAGSGCIIWLLLF